MIRRLDIGVAALLAGGVLFACRDNLLAMVRLWSASPMYSYAFMVPAISLFILWSRRSEFRACRLQPARLVALPVLALGLALFVLGELAAAQLLQDFAFLLAIAGIVLFLFGTEYFWVSLPALGYLLFMIPLWDVFTEPLHGPFQQNSARLGVAILHAIGIPAHREDTFITLPNLTLEVARACSGVNYLVAVLALALPLSYLRLTGIWRRVLLIGSAMIIAALANGLRVALIGSLAYLEIGSPLHGPFHVLHGLFVAGIGYVVLFAGLHLLETGAPPAVKKEPAADVRSPRWRVLDAGILAAAFWAIAVVGVVPASAPVVLAHPLDDLPRQLGDWFTVPPRPDEATGSAFPWSNADQRLRRRYRNGDGFEVAVDVAYFEAQRQNREVVGFQTAELHRQASARPISLPGGAVLKANLIRRPEQGEVALFWYDINGVAESNQYAAKLLSVWHALIDGRTNGAAMMLRAHVTEGREDSAVTALEKLAVALQEKLGGYWSSVAPRAPAPKTT